MSILDELSANLPPVERLRLRELAVRWSKADSSQVMREGHEIANRGGSLASAALMLAVATRENRIVDSLATQEERDAYVARLEVPTSVGQGE